MEADNPILNSPYDEPLLHYATDDEGALDYSKIVESYVKNAFLGFAIPHVADGKDRQYFPDFIARVRVEATPSSLHFTERGGGGAASTFSPRHVNLIVEVTGMNTDKAEKRWHLENRWLPAVNAVRERYDMDEWAFIEIADDIRDIKNQLIARIGEF